MKIMNFGCNWRNSSLVWGNRVGSGQTSQAISPLNGSVIQSIDLLDDQELQRLVGPGQGALSLNSEELRAFCARLSACLNELRGSLIEATQWETAFIPADCMEMVDGTLTYADEYGEMHLSGDSGTGTSLMYEHGTQRRAIQLTEAPWGTIAVILPQNAFLFLAVTCMLNALAAGNRVILRAPLHSARSAALLACAIEKAGGGDRISVVQMGAKEFTAALYASPLPCLLHYMGSSRHASRVVSEAFAHGKGCLIDGEGNGWAWVDGDADPQIAAQLLISSALRYNGQTCTSTNGAFIHPKIYAQVRERLLTQWDRVKAGNPRCSDVKVGPLFDETQASWCRERALKSGGSILRGGLQEGNLLHPILVEKPTADSDLVREGIFGPILWIMPGTQEQFADWWPHNHFPLSACILSRQPNTAWWTERLSGLARLVINGDPSCEYIHEPWGGYPACGLNPVSEWRDKYRRVVQIDKATTSVF